MNRNVLPSGSLHSIDAAISNKSLAYISEPSKNKPFISRSQCCAYLTPSFSLGLKQNSHQWFPSQVAESWKIPSPSKLSLNQWAQHQRFRINDTLIWKYDPKSETVLQVDEEDYKSCNLSDPIQEYSDGDTKVVLEHSGSFYFISGIEGHCQKGLKLVVVVMSNSHKAKQKSPTPAPAPLPFALPPAVGAAASSFGGGFTGLVMAMGVLLVMV
ncbi:hypothetical protein L6164_011532 [Bauhinia variegata]|uniref:Uncharacterized protein n=1 Tax=Bauhinia variegata TaxID=167791 RepID=A0ACB9P7E0_BAUVA|nr:hypothetical protein L6164_011532 [Bauhinia variegata]